MRTPSRTRGRDDTRPLLAPALLLAALASAGPAGAGDRAVELDAAASLERDTRPALHLSLHDDAMHEPDASLALPLPLEESTLRAFIEECVELEAVPLLDICGSRHQRVFFGVDFDGTLGVHLRL